MGTSAIDSGDFEFLKTVSIQLMSPASGDTVSTFSDANCVIAQVSIQLMSPASGDLTIS